MNKFSDFSITKKQVGFEGDKIKIDWIINMEISIHYYEIVPSKFDSGNGKRLTLQITFNGRKHIVFTGSKALMDMIQQVPEDKFPFSTTIVKNEKAFTFT